MSLETGQNPMTEKIPDSFRAFRIRDDEDGYRAAIENQSIDDQSEGDVVIRVHYSSINYKDALAATGKGKILRDFPLNGGIDAAGEVVTSESEHFSPGDPVILTGCGLSETRDGGYSEYLRVPSEWLVPCPAELSLEETMVLGTAGFTAGLSLYRMEANGQLPDMGPILVTGATGGVGSLAVDILNVAGYEVHALTGKIDRFEWLESLGAAQCISRHDIEWGKRPMESAHWAGAIDNVGGETLSALTRVIRPWGSIASCGLAGGIGLETTVMPFIIRGISLLGINSSGCPYALRREIWARLASDWRPQHLDSILTGKTDLDGMEAIFPGMLKGESLGRKIVQLNGSEQS